MTTAVEGRRKRPQKIITKASELASPDLDNGSKAYAPPLPSDSDEWVGVEGDLDILHPRVMPLTGGHEIVTVPPLSITEKVLTKAAIKRVAGLYSGPFYGPTDPQHRGPDQSPYIIGLKRALCHWTMGTGALKWQPGGNFNATFNMALETDVAAFKAHKGIKTPGSVWGSQAHAALMEAIRGGGAPSPFEPEQSAVDLVSVHLFENAYDLKHPQERNLAKVWAEMAGFLEEMEYFDSIWHYLQQRPIGSMGVAPEHGGKDDCSALAIASAYWTRTHTGIYLPDPLGYNWSGYGNTVSAWVTNMRRKLGLSAVFEVGDEALYGAWASKHMSICRKRGTIDKAIFTSHGSEAGPNPTYANYRNDLFAIVRPTFVPLELAA